MSESIHACVGRVVWHEVVICSMLLGIAIYELVGVIWLRLSQRNSRMECTKCLQSLISMSLVAYLIISVWFLCFDFNGSYSCDFLYDIVWLSYVVLTTLIYIFYYVKQRVLSNAMNMNKVNRWRRLLNFLTICLILCFLISAVFWPFML